MLKTAQETVQSYRASSPRAPTKRASPSYAPREEATSDQSDDDFGPAPPSNLQRHQGHGPTIPKLDDLTYRNELRAEDREKGQMDYVDDIRHARKNDRKSQKEALEDLVPRADPGSHAELLPRSQRSRRTGSTRVGSNGR